MTANTMDTTQFQRSQIESLFQNQQLDVSELALNYPSQLIYVSQDGNNSNTGTINSPYLTVSYAMQQITGNTVSTPYFIVVVGNISDSTIALKPNVSIVGVSPGATITGGTIVADTSWSSAASGSTSYLYNLIVATVNFVPTASVVANFNMYFLTVDGTTTLNVGNSHSMLVLAYNNTFKNTVNVDNIFLYSIANRFQQPVKIAQNTGLANTVLNSSGDSYFASATITASTQGFITQLHLVGCQVTSNISANTNVAIYMDAVSYPQSGTVSLSGSATLTLTSPSNAVGLPPSYTPVNYSIVQTTNTSPSVQGCLEGIDSALALNPVWTIVTGTSQTMAPGGNYFATNASMTTFTMPGTINAGSVINVAGFGTAGFEIQMVGSQVLQFGNQATNGLGGGNLQVRNPSTNSNSAVSILCTQANTNFIVLNAQGDFIPT